MEKENDLLPQQLSDPKIDASAFIADGAKIIGDVTIAAKVGVWYNAVMRGDENSITIGEETNVQDNSTLHCSPGFPLSIGKGVTIGHNCIVHGCTIGDNTLIGMGSTILNGAKIGANCLVGAGSLVTQGTVIPDGSLAFGSPAKVIRPLTKEEAEGNRKNCETYLALAELHKKKA